MKTKVLDGIVPNLSVGTHFSAQTNVYDTEDPEAPTIFRVMKSKWVVGPENLISEGWAAWQWADEHHTRYQNNPCPSDSIRTCTRHRVLFSSLETVWVFGKKKTAEDRFRVRMALWRANKVLDILAEKMNG